LKMWKETKQCKCVCVIFMSRVIIANAHVLSLALSYFFKFFSHMISFSLFLSLSLSTYVMNVHRFLDNASCMVSNLNESRTRLFHENIKHVSSLHESQKTMQEESEQWCSHQHAENDSHLKECENVIRSIESSFEITSIASRDVTSMLDIRADEDADVRL
jgi:hypothetical protein